MLINTSFCISLNKNFEDNTQLPLQHKFSILGMDIESVTKAASLKLGILKKVRRIFSPKHLCLL